MANTPSARLFLFPTVLWVWGANSHGELGDAANVDTNHPITTAFFPAGTTLRKLAAGDGEPLDGSHSLAVDDNQHAWGWGFNTFGEVGNGQGGNNVFVPAQVCGTGQTSPCTQFIGSVVAVSAGGFHSLALDGIGTVWGWGFNQNGQVGVQSGSTVAPVRNTPLFAQLHQQPGAPVATAIAAGANHSLALDSRGVVWGWGTNSSGELGNGTFSYPPDGAPYIAWAINFPEPVTIAAIAAGGSHSLALDTNGVVWAWGSNQFGELGLSSFVDKFNTPQKLIFFPANTRILAIAAGASHSLAIDSAGRVWAWGRNQAGQLGNQTQIDSHGPSLVLFPTTFPRVAAIAAGGAHSLAIDTGGTLWAWGSNSNGQLGNPAFGNVMGPIRPPFPDNTHIATVAAGRVHSLALESRSFFFGLEAVLDVELATAEMTIVPQHQSNIPATVSVRESAAKGDRTITTVVLSDEEHHTLELTLEQERHDGKIAFELRSLQYNGGAPQSPGSNRVEYHVSEGKGGLPHSIHQHLRLHSAAGRLEITAHFSAERDETTIHVSSGSQVREFTRHGMALFRLGTMNGAIGFSDGTETWLLPSNAS